MITIKNESHESFQLRQVIDHDTPGCRVIGTPEAQVIKAGQEIALLGYEPGIRYILEPLKRREIPRNFLQPGGDPYNRVGIKAIP